MTVNEQSIDKYLNGIITINSTLGKLDTLRLHLMDNNDVFSLKVIESIIDDLSKVCGVNYKSININNNNYNANSFDVKTVNSINVSRQNNNIRPSKPTVIEVIEDENYIYPEEKEENIANATLEMKKIKIRERLNKKIEKDVKGVYLDKKTGDLVYKFINSNTLDFMSYNKFTKELTIRFLQNCRTYLYKNVPLYVFDNLHITDENGASAGAYFQQNVAKKKETYKYKEITDSQLIG